MPIFLTIIYYLFTHLLYYRKIFDLVALNFIHFDHLNFDFPQFSSLCEFIHHLIAHL